MFEVEKDKEETKKMGALIGIAGVIVLVVVGAYVYTHQCRPQTAVSAAVTPKEPADAVRDLKVLRAKMDKDRTGTWAVWTLSLSNRSSGYTYSEIQYETSYMCADNRVLVLNKGTLPGSIAPGEQRDIGELRDALFPAGTAWYEFRITAAKSAVR